MEDVETRTVLTPRTGTKVCVLVGLAFIVLAVYFFVVPITSVRTTSGAVFGCGTGLKPAHGSFADGVCWRIADTNRYRAYAALGVGVVTIIAGALLFGFDRREEERQIPRGHHEYDDRRDDRWQDDDRSDDDREARHDVRAADSPPRRRRTPRDTDRYDRDDQRSSRRHEQDDDPFDDEPRSDRPARRITPDGR